ncbi:hypothetical protein [Actinomadura madurae]|uniref:hypothetical protein n=2 Tax=Actinomadura madurae TaxID=1993 RepID=UPI0020265BC8|nr:hypothetical protein [Actinomadura madurae]MCP9947388.1 hypothetical protein [Actinomadura madurae]MCP9964151.1 hypothetical protein [Actinomadura madurae]MCP9976628.1 hypothetical protein [Actinomadura madurae]MCQ0011878.1 hypothetical protein [Actinomadura madurae]MCQ0012824.1 hypothetical protein [Actinomadura madurae]
MVEDRNAILWGAAPERLSGSDFPAMDRRFGPLTIRRSYQPAAAGMPASWADCNGGADLGKRASCWSGKPPVGAMADGSLDRRTLAFLRSIPRSHVAFVSIWHEGDAKIRRGEFSAAAYRAALRRFCRLVKQVQAEGRPHLYTIQILTTWSGTSPSAGTTYADTWPGDGLVDCFGVDGYSHVGSGASLWGPAVRFARSKGIPWAVPEIGYGRTGTQDVRWMRDQIAYLTSTPGGGERSRAAFACWFNTDGPISTPTPGNRSSWLAAARAASQAYRSDYTSFVL